MKKRCSYCRNVKLINDFWKNTSRKDKHQSICIECHKYLSKKYYKKKENKKRHAEIVKKLKKSKVAFLKHALKDYLARHPCVDCGEKDPNVLEFDHVNKEKKNRGISVMIGSANPWERVLKEIEKCVVRCCNCHRKRTLKQFGWKRV